MTTATDLSAWTRTIQVKERDGVLFATSEEEPTLFVSAPNSNALFGLVEHALASLFREVYKRDVLVFQTDKVNFSHKEMVLIDKASCAARSAPSACA